MEDSQTPQPFVEQVTSKTPATRVKDAKKVAAGQARQRKAREAREAQKKYFKAKEKELDKAKAKIEELEKTDAELPSESAKITTQWLGVISIIVSLVGLYYKREEIKSVFKQAPPPVRQVAPPVRQAPPPISGVKRMD